MSRDLTRIKQVVKKLKALAERGVGAEKVSAQSKLDRILAKNGLTERDLISDEVSYYLFSYKYPYRYKLMCQIIYKVLGPDDLQVFKSHNTRNKIGAYCTNAQKVEIELEFDFYSALLDEEIDILTSAFISKQDIYPEDTPVKTLNESDLTEEELNLLRKKQNYANQISKRKRSVGLISQKD